MHDVRIARQADLDALLKLFAASEVSRAAEPADRAAQIWSQILSRDGVSVFVADRAGELIATCMLITIPNLLRGGRQHGFLENVLVRSDVRGQGYGRAVVGAALAAAWTADCFHVLLQSGRADPRVHRFYARCGFEPGLRTAYVARRRPVA
ncbi:MAG: GNAT family N-acetyltransferase [Hyphomicrobiales bacterium]|nr:GNAT family N-acetyltransferase [Hyphomicrobiales bacterium]